MANEARRARLRRFVTVMQPKRLVVRRGLDDAGVYIGKGARLLVDVAHRAVIHPIVCGDAFRNIVAVHAICHFRQLEGREARAGRDTIVAGGAIKVISLTPLEMLRVRELDVIVLT